MDEEEEEQVIGIVGQYTVTHSPRIGGGTFGTVHKAVHNVTNQTVAAKQILLTDSGKRNEAMCKMAELELSIIQGLQGHNNIVKLYGHVKRVKTFWIFMEFCDQQNLCVYLKENPDMEVCQRVKIMQQLASAVCFMHGQEPSIIHRDLKLENIMLKREGTEDVVKVGDFGLSKFFENQSLSTAFQHGKFMTTTCGSHFFMAPEFFAESDGGTKYDASVDVFAIGLAFLVVLQNCRNYDPIPLSVESRKENKFVNIGYEMISRYREKRPLPTICSIEPDDSPVAKKKKVPTATLR